MYSPNWYGEISVLGLHLCITFLIMIIYILRNILPNGQQHNIEQTNVMHHSVCTLLLILCKWLLVGCW